MSKENTFEKEFVPYQESLELKELDFDEVCLAHYVVSTQTMNKDKIYLRIGRLDYDDIYKKYKLENIPTFSQAFKWFREKYNLKGFVSPVEYLDGTDDTYHWCVYNECNSGNEQLTHEEAELACLRKLIQIAKNKI